MIKVIGKLVVLTHSDTLLGSHQLKKLTQQVGRDWAVVDKKSNQNKEIFKGDFNLIQLRDGLTLHTADGFDAHTFTTQATIKPRIGLMIFLQGQCDVHYGERKISLGTTSCRNQAIVAEAVLVAINRQETFTREAHKGRYLRKIVVGIDPCWLENSGFAGLEGYQAIHQFSQQHLKVKRQLVSASMQATIEKILNPAAYPAFLNNLYCEGLTLELVSEALMALTDASRLITDQIKIHPYEKRRVNSALELLENTADVKTLSLDFIAEQVGTNTNTLQRNFRQVVGMTVFEYLRCRRLTEAKNALENNQVNVLEAALMAGYNGAANFCTAFKRQFGVTPSQVRTKIHRI